MENPLVFEMQGPIGARATVNGREVDYFGGCGYLGLQNHPALIQAASDSLKQYGISIATSTVEHPLYTALTEEARVFFDADQILYFASGYLGMVTLTQGLRAHYEHIFIDKEAHSSVWAGAHSTGKPITPFRHCDAKDLVEICRRELKSAERPLILSDGVFPVSGEIAPAPDYLEVADKYDGVLCLDDAHAVGVLGEHGRGTLEYYGISSDRCYASYTLSKALGTYGGLIAGSDHTIQTICENSHVNGGATKPPLPIAAAARQALLLVRTNHALRQRLAANVHQVRAGLRMLGWQLPDNPVPIICLAARPSMDLAQIQAALFDRHICVTHSRDYSSVPEGGALRIAVFATHTSEQIDRLLDNLKRTL